MNSFSPKIEKPSLILLRGLPGSGKTLFANLIAENKHYPCFSVDDYFTNALTGEYNFIFSENHLAYSACEENTRKAMANKEQKIIVHNTFTMEWEIAPYFEMAKEFGYAVFVLTVEKRHEGNNVHGVTQEQIEKMASKYQLKLV
jgi:predicted kinase